MAQTDPSEIREAAREILSRSEFDARNPGWVDRAQYYLENPIEAVADGFDWLIGFLPWSETGAAIYAWAFAIMLVSAVIYLLLKLSKGTLADPSSASLIRNEVQQQSAADILKEALEAEQAENWRLAIRLRYAALIAQLSLEGLLERRPGKTTREYLSDLSVNAPLRRPAFENATSTFEWAWYGNAEVGKSHLDYFKSAADEVLSRNAA